MYIKKNIVVAKTFNLRLYIYVSEVPSSCSIEIKIDGVLRININEQTIKISELLNDLASNLAGINRGSE